MGKAEDSPGYKDACPTHTRATEGIGFAIPKVTPEGEKVGDFWSSAGRNVTYDSWNDAITSWCNLRKDASLIPGAHFNQYGIFSTCLSNCNSKLLGAQNISLSVQKVLIDVCKDNCDEQSNRFDAYAKGFAAGKETCAIGGLKAKPIQAQDPHRSIQAR